MLVKIAVSIAGPNHAYAPGQVVDLPDDIARAWLESGNATKPEKEEIATMAPNENASANKRGRPRNKG